MLLTADSLSEKHVSVPLYPSQTPCGIEHGPPQ